MPWVGSSAPAASPTKTKGPRATRLAHVQLLAKKPRGPTGWAASNVLSGTALAAKLMNVSAERPAPVSRTRSAGRRMYTRQESEPLRNQPTAYPGVVAQPKVLSQWTPDRSRPPNRWCSGSMTVSAFSQRRAPDVLPSAPTTSLAWYSVVPDSSTTDTVAPCPSPTPSPTPTTLAGRTTVAPCDAAQVRSTSCSWGWENPIAGNRSIEIDAHGSESARCLSW